MEYTVYEDKPASDIGMKMVVLLAPAILLITAIILYLNGEVSGTLYLVAISMMLSLVMPSLIPRRYCLLDSKLRIEMGGPLAVNIPFKSITAVRPARWSSMGINLPANFRQSDALEIMRKGGMSVIITPRDKAAFIENFEKVFGDWKRDQGDPA